MKRHFYIVIWFLLILGFGVFGYKLFYLKFPLGFGSEARNYLIESEVHFDAFGGPLTAKFAIPPQEGVSYSVLDETFLTGKYRGSPIETTKGHRQLIWSVKDEQPGPQVLYYRATIGESAESIGLMQEDSRKGPTTPKNIEARYTKDELGKQRNMRIDKAASQVVSEIRNSVADDEIFILETLSRIRTSRETDPNLKLIGDLYLNNATDPELAVIILRQAGIPARVAHGIRLSPEYLHTGRTVSTISWIEVWQENQWKAFGFGNNPYLTKDHYALWYDDRTPLRLTGAENETVNWSVSSVRANDRNLIDRDDFFYRFSVFNLPIRTQEVYRILLAVPIGAMLIVFFRNIVGIETFGTFMPVLIAMAFRETKLFWGISLFLALLLCGVAFRFYLAHFKLLLVPRLATILTMVVMMMLGVSIMSQKLDLIGGMSVALFPMVIITMTIERMSIVWEERGPKAALVQTFGSLICGIAVYQVITNSLVEHLIFVFPELLLVNLVGLMLMGRYTGFRLSEVIRFKALSKEIGNV